MNGDAEARLDASWTMNAGAWTEAVRRGLIESRRLVTDDAVADAVAACGGTRVLDVGCGEGWLARRLSREGREVVGFDGSRELVDRAREMGGGTFVESSYAAFVADPARVGTAFDVAVCNFSLLGESVRELLRALALVVVPDGRLVVQTVHPSSGGDGPDGWREERFEPLRSLDFQAMPWYRRGTGSWTTEMERGGWRVTELREPEDPRSGAPASLIIIARPEGSR